MALTWRIESTEADVNTGEITEAYWEASDYEIVGEGSKQVLHRGRLYGTEKLEADSSSEGFIRWQDVTEENVLNWAKSALGAEKVAEIETEIARQIAESKTPVVTYENPWESTPEPE